MVWQRGAFWGQCGNVFDVSVSALSLVCFGVYMADIDQELEAGLLVGKARPVGPASQNMPANWLRLAEAGGRPELDLALAGRAGGRIGRSLRLPCTQVVFLTLMVVWVAVRLARLATVAKNLHSQRRFSAMQVSRPAHTYPRVRGAPPGACLRGRAPPCKRRAPLSKEGPHPSCACVSRRRWTSTSPPRAPRTKETS